MARFTRAAIGLGISLCLASFSSGAAIGCDGPSEPASGAIPSLGAHGGDVAIAGPGPAAASGESAPMEITAVAIGKHVVAHAPEYAASARGILRAVYVWLKS